jgi:hypothetical protein
LDGTQAIAGPVASVLQFLLDVINGFYRLSPVLQDVLRHQDKRCSSGMDDQIIARSQPSVPFLSHLRTSLDCLEKRTCPCQD